MTVGRGHTPVARVQARYVAAIVQGSKGGNAYQEKEVIVPLGNGGRLRPPLFYGHDRA